MSTIYHCFMGKKAADILTRHSRKKAELAEFHLGFLSLRVLVMCMLAHCHTKSCVASELNRGLIIVIM